MRLMSRMWFTDSGPTQLYSKQLLSNEYETFSGIGTWIESRTGRLMGNEVQRVSISLPVVCPLFPFCSGACHGE